MSIAQDIRDAVRTAKAASETRPGDPFKEVLDEVAQGLTDDSVEARFRPGPGGRWTLWLWPACRPGRSAAMLTVVISAGSAEVLGNPTRSATTPEQLAEILKGVVTAPPFLESLQVMAELLKQPVEGFLRTTFRTVSREDLMLEVPPETQREIAGKVDKEVSLLLRIADFPGAGTFKIEAGYKVLESAGYTVTITDAVTQNVNGALRVVGRVSLAVPA